MLTGRKEKSADNFWNEYEEKTGEKVLKRGLGKYVKGWDEFDEKKLGGIWGLVISTSGGFRFHHFPQTSWIEALAAGVAANREIKEKTIFIPNERIISSEVIKETKWLKKIFNSQPPMIIIDYKDEEGNNKKLLFEAEYGV